MCSKYDILWLKTTISPVEQACTLPFSTHYHLLRRFLLPSHRLSSNNHIFHQLLHPIWSPPPTCTAQHLWATNPPSPSFFIDFPGFPVPHSTSINFYQPSTFTWGNSNGNFMHMCTPDLGICLPMCTPLHIAPWGLTYPLSCQFSLALSSSMAGEPLKTLSFWGATPCFG